MHFTIKVNHCGLSYGASLACFPVNVTLETESNLYQLSYLFLPIHTSAVTAQAGVRVDLNGYTCYQQHKHDCLAKLIKF
jgi:hypothetical protein